MTIFTVLGMGSKLVFDIPNHVKTEYTINIPSFNSIFSMKNI